MPFKKRKKNLHPVQNLRCNQEKKNMLTAKHLIFPPLQIPISKNSPQTTFKVINKKKILSLKIQCFSFINLETKKKK